MKSQQSQRVAIHRRLNDPSRLLLSQVRHKNKSPPKTLFIPLMCLLLVSTLKATPQETPNKITSTKEQTEAKNQLNQGQKDPFFPFPPQTGKVKIFDGDSNDMFYWIFPAQESPETAPVLIWLQGGPGCSSTGGIFTEIGPFYFSGWNQTKAQYRPVNWNQKANTLFVDQPLGTGFSTVTAERVVKNHQEVGNQFLLFYEGFLEQHPEFKGRDLYVSGESYGGHWVPFTAHTLHKSNNPDIRLKGIAIGNGYLDPYSDYVRMPDFAYKYRNFTHLSEDLWIKYKKMGELCLHMSNFRPYNRYYTFTALEVCEGGVSGGIIDNAFKFVPKFDQYYMPSNRPTNESFVPFLNSEAVQKYLKVNKTYADCNDTFGDYFVKLDNFVDSREMIIPLLHDGVKVMVYNGALDFICNYDMQEASFAAMDWRGINEWNKIDLKDCEYGLCKEHLNLRYVRFAGAGHMVPIFFPEKSRDMINSFMEWDWKKGNNQEEDL